MHLIGRTLAHYRISAAIGAGGMGEVYRATDTKLGRAVALKVLPAEIASDPGRLERFHREARAVAALNHPHIVTLHSVEEAGGVHFLTMELVEGQPLDRVIPEGGLPVGRILEIATALAEALAAAHEKGIVHRDLKPGNVMIGADGRVKVLDFGLAKVEGAGAVAQADSALPTREHTREGVVMGTMPYMSPEQVEGREVDHRTDIFSLGVVLHEMATGSQPFGGSSAAGLLSAILRDPAPAVAAVRPDLPGDLGRLIDRCLEKDRQRRPQTAGAVRDDLAALRRRIDSGAGASPISGVGGRPGVAVLPFENRSGDPEQEYFADGMVEEIITGLSRIKWLFVISRNSTSIYKGRPIDVRTVGQELGVRYVLEGSVRRSGNRVRMTGRLIETATAANVWADRYDGTLDDIFALQDQMTMSVIGAVEPTLRKAEVERARRKRPDNLDAYDLYLRALPFAAAAMPQDADKALELLGEAIRLQPDYAIVHGMIAWCHEQRYLRGGLHAETREAARRHAHAAIGTGSDDALALALGGFVVGIVERNYETALDALDHSLALSPSSALAFGFSSVIRAYSGDYATAIEHARMGVRFSPYDPLIYLPYVGLALAHFFSGNFVEAASAASRASAANPRFSVPCYVHAAALQRLGRTAEARALADRVLALQPGFTVSGLVSSNITAPERMASLVGALREVGLPE